MATPGDYNPTTPGYPARPQIRFDAIAEAWNLFTQQMGAWIGALLIAFAVAIGIYIIGIVVVVGMVVGASSAGGNAGGAAAGLGMLLFLAIYVVLWCAMSYLLAGLYRMAVRQVRGEQISAGDVFSAGDVWLSVLGATILIAIAVGIASIFLVIPGLILAGLLMLTVPLIVDQKMGVMDAMQQSFNTLKPEWLMATLFYFVLGILAGLGGIVIVGILFTYPLLFLGQAIVYRDFFLAQQVPTATVPPMPVVGQPIAPMTPSPVASVVTPPPTTVEPNPVQTTPPLEETTPPLPPQEPSEEPPAE